MVNQYEEKKKRVMPVDEGKVDNAYLSITNDYDTYSQSLSPYETSLEKKKDKGVYEKAKAEKGYRTIVDRYNRTKFEKNQKEYYEEEFYSNPSYQGLNAREKDEVAKKLREEFEAEKGIK